MAGSTKTCLNPTPGETVCNTDAGMGGTLNESAVWSGQTLTIAPTAGLFGEPVGATSGRLETGRKRYFNLHECGYYASAFNDIFVISANADYNPIYRAGTNVSNTADSTPVCGPGNNGGSSTYVFHDSAIKVVDLLGRRYLNLHECGWLQGPAVDLLITNGNYGQGAFSAGTNASNTADTTPVCGPGGPSNYFVYGSSVHALDLRDKRLVNLQECNYSNGSGDLESLSTIVEWGGGPSWATGTNASNTADTVVTCGPGNSGLSPGSRSVSTLDTLDTARGRGYIEFQMVANASPGVHPQTADLSGSNFTTQTDSGNLTVIGLPDLTTVIGQPSPAFVAGQPSSVPIMVINSGTLSTTGPITTTMTLPPGTSAPASFTSGSNTCTTSAQTVTCTQPGPLAVGDSSTLQVPVTPDVSTVGTTPGPFTGTTSTPSETNTGNNAG